MAGFFLCLSDGMGSGIEAFKESEIVVELLEQFLESGFSQETAARMVNSALLLKGREGMFLLLISVRWIFIPGSVIF